LLAAVVPSPSGLKINLRIMASTLITFLWNVTIPVL